MKEGSTVVCVCVCVCVCGGGGGRGACFLTAMMMSSCKDQSHDQSHDHDCSL